MKADGLITTRFGRREIFRRAGAAGLLLAPVLRARISQAAPAPRFVAMYFPNGAPGKPDEVFFPDRAGNRWVWKGKATEVLAPFSRHLTVVRKLLVNRGHRGKGAHGGAHIAWLTGTDELRFPDRDQHQAASHSLDTHVARLTGTKKLYLAVDPGRHEAFRISYDGFERPAHPETDPQQAYRALFGPVVGACDPRSLRRDATRGLAVLDALVEDLRAANRRFGLDAAERAKLERYEQSLVELEADLRRQRRNPDCRSRQAPALSFEGQDAAPVRVRLHTDILVAALSLGLARAAALQLYHAYSNENYSGWLEVPSQGHHSQTHNNNPQRTQNCGRIMRWHAEQLAYLLGKLAAVREPGGTLLDNSLVMWGSDVPNAFTHVYTEPHCTMVFGGASGRLRRGQDIDVGARNHVDLLATVCRALGVEDAHFRQRKGFADLIRPMLT